MPLLVTYENQLDSEFLVSAKLLFRHPCGIVVAALGVDGGPESMQGRGQIFFRKDGDPVDARQGGHDLGPFGGGLKGTAPAPEAAGAFIPVEGHDQEIAESTGLLERPHVAHVQEIEDPVAEDRAPAGFPEFAQAGRQGVPGEDLFLGLQGPIAYPHATRFPGGSRGPHPPQPL